MIEGTMPLAEVINYEERFGNAIIHIPSYYREHKKHLSLSWSASSRNDLAVGKILMIQPAYIKYVEPGNRKFDFISFRDLCTYGLVRDASQVENSAWRSDGPPHIDLVLSDKLVNNMLVVGMWKDISGLTIDYWNERVDKSCEGTLPANKRMFKLSCDIHPLGESLWPNEALQIEYGPRTVKRDLKISELRKSEETYMFNVTGLDSIMDAVYHQDEQYLWEQFERLIAMELQKLGNNISHLPTAQR